MAMTALFRGKKGQEIQVKQSSVPTPPLHQEEDDEDDLLRGSEPIRRNSRFYRSMRKKRNREKSSSYQQNSPTMPHWQSQSYDPSIHRQMPKTPKESLPIHNGTAHSPSSVRGGAWATTGESRLRGAMEGLRERTENCSLQDAYAHPNTLQHNTTRDTNDITLRDALENMEEDASHIKFNIMKNVGCLYQEYRDSSKKQEVEQRRQCEGTAAQAPALQLQLRSHTRSLSLWQNLPAVQESGLLTHLPQKEVILQEAIFELVTSEASYYKSLELLETHFLRNPSLFSTLSHSDMHFLFSNIEDVIKASERFLMDLEHRIEESILISDVCDIVHHHAANYFSVFITYVINQGYQEKSYRRILQENGPFREIMSQLENHPRVRGLSFTSFLILPFQRITRLKLLVQNILKKVEENSEREMNAVKAHKELEQIVKECNEGVRKMNRTEELIGIEKTLEFKSKSVPVISHSRWLLKKGEVLQMAGPKNTRTLRSKKLYQPIYLFLFNNLLLITKHSSSNEKFQVLDSCSRSMLRTEDMDDQGQMLACVFVLKLLENQEERTVSYMMKTSCMSDKLRWIYALTPNLRTRFLSASAHQTDCPQVQCIQSYSSQEPDELSIEMADVLQVLEKTEDGWILGERLHDGERGWFPCRVVEGILNFELRAQNLRECQRIQLAQGGASRGRRTHKQSKPTWSSESHQE
ncbi:ephexin-1 isoform X2 [Denticeps clupeoides]|uniref:Neuronal guanine nucleotide exchange factor n=1 Tax=Denticeps clupeoides TaxID=299321 RepID=A0AAY4D942_9TELE|nr:ephexin-1 isoform X2 [Denticeps clupeoides]